MYNGDGNKSHRRYTISMKNEQLFKDTIKLLIESGYVPRYSDDGNCYRICWSDKNMHIKPRNYGEVYTKEVYHGKVYNLTVADNHTVCVGENGKFMWTGQSLYGALGSPYFNFYNLDNAIAITLSGQTLIKYLSENVNKYLKMKYKLKQDQICLIDTDSVYLSFDEIINNLGLKFNTNQEFLNWSYKFIEDIIDPFFVKILDIFADRYNTDNLIKFNREKISRNMLVLDGKKKYALSVLDNEGKVYDEPKIAVKGIEVVRTSTPVFCRNRLSSSLELIFETQDVNQLTDFIKQAKKDFNKEKIESIAFPRGVSDYKKYAKSYAFYKKNGLQYPKGIPVANRAAINYNYLVDRFDLKLQKVDNGTKLKFIYIKPDNMLNQNVIAFIGNYPEKFKEIFEIDYKTQFEKAFKNVIQRFFDAMKWGDINFSAKKLAQFFN
jgi:DNA polymerase elongation subunit (family B)